MPYDKRVIEFPYHHSPKMIETYPLGHYRVPIMEKTRDIAIAIRTLVLAFMKGDKGFPLYSAFDHLYARVNTDGIRVSLVNDN